MEGREKIPMRIFNDTLRVYTASSGTQYVKRISLLYTREELEEILKYFLKDEKKIKKELNKYFVIK